MDNIFQVVQERYNIVDVAQNLGIDLHRVGGSYRAGSIAHDGGGDNAFTVYPLSNRWWDFKLNIGGDITDLVAFVKFNGDKKAALIDLLPDFVQQIDPFMQERKKFMHNVEKFHSFLFSEHSAHVLKYLHKRGLTDDYIHTVKLGINREIRIFIPYWDFSGKKIEYFITRRSVSIYGTENETSAKYKKASQKDFPFLHNSPCGLHTLARNNDALFITEGAFDAMLLDQSGASVLSPLGGDFSQNWDFVINSAKEFKFVILAFDNDSKGQDFTFQAAKKLIKNRIPFKCAVFLGKDIAEFFANGGSLNTLLNSTRSGYSWIANRFVEGKRFEELNINERDKIMDEFKALLMDIAPMSDKSDIEKIINQVKHFFPSEWLKAAKKDALAGPDEMVLAEKVIDNFNIKYDDRTGVYQYSERGCWSHITDNELKNIVVKVIGRKCTAAKMSAVTKLVKAASQSRELITKLDKLPIFSLKNYTLHFNYEKGLVDIKEHSQNDYVTTQAGYAFDKKAKSTIFLPALKQIFNGNEDSITTLQEFFGYVFLNDCRYHKALVALGCGGNGKSVITDVLRALLGGLNDEGKGLVSAVMLSKFSKDFRTMVLKNSWVNISSETDIRVDGAEANFKIITSGEPIEDSYKGKDPVTFLSRTKLIINCNEFPIFADKSKGLARRLLFLEFPVNFVDNPRQGTNEMKVDYDLVNSIINNPQEMAGILNWALKGLGRILKQSGFTITPSQKKLLEQFEHYNNPVLNFTEEKENLLYDEDGNGKEVPKSTLYSIFKEWTEKNGENIYSARYFYHTLENTIKAMGGEVQHVQRHIIGRCFLFGKKPIADKAA